MHPRARHNRNQTRQGDKPRIPKPSYVGATLTCCFQAFVPCANQCTANQDCSKSSLSVCAPGDHFFPTTEVAALTKLPAAPK